MSLGLVGRKVGMTRVFAEDGSSIPVTVLDVSNNRVTQIKTPETDGYAAVQVTFGKRRASRVSKPAAGHLAKAGVEAGEVLSEFRVAPDQLALARTHPHTLLWVTKIAHKILESGFSHAHRNRQRHVYAYAEQFNWDNFHSKARRASKA